MIDGLPVTVPEGTLVIRAAERVGLYVPRFCDHPYLKPAGACRQCLVEVEGQRKPLTSCTTVCTEGMVVKTQHTSAIARDGQEGVLELLLINHPLDCPQCDKGGECPLQDQTLAYGPSGSRFIDQKRRFVKPVPVNDLVYLDRERCVLCARCTRFADEITGDPFIELFERGALQQVAIYEDDPYESNFSGNVIQICPVGALTSKDFRFSARPFDMTSTASTCTQCASGCSITVQERRSSIVRVLADEDPNVNDVWSCDKGRFAHSYVTDESRLTEPMVRKSGELIAVSWAEALRVAADLIRSAQEDGAPIGVISGGNLLDEDAYALSRFTRSVLGTNDVALSATPMTPEAESVLAQALTVPGASNPSIDGASLIVVAGLDLYEESPIVYLRVRKAAARGASVIQVNARRTQLPGSATIVAPDRIASEIAALAATVNAAAGRTVILAGERLAMLPGALPAAWTLAQDSGAAFAWIPRKGGARGALAGGLHPAFVPSGADALWSGIPAERGRSLREILEQMATGSGVVLCVGADPATDADDAKLGARAIAGGSTVISLDMFPTVTTARADVVLPVASPAERDGTMTNWEGRPRPVRRSLDPAGLSTPDWEVLSRLASELGREFPSSLQQIRSEMAQVSPTMLTHETGRAEATHDGRNHTFPFALVSYRLLLDRGTMMTGAKQLSAVVRKPFAEINPEDAGRIGITDGERIRIAGPNGAGEAAAVIATSVPPGVVFVPFDQPGLRMGEIADVSAGVPAVSLEKVR